MPTADAVRSVRVRVPAKINLYLGVGGVRADGFHELVTVFHAVDLHDEIRATTAPDLEIRITGEGAADLPTGPGNLAWRAASLLAERHQVPPHVLIELTKAIPVGGGLAGGSADAAATLVACSALWQTGSSRRDLIELGGELGSDVPFTLTGGTALGTGRGELLTPALTTGAFHWVLAIAAFGISTAEAYRAFDRQHDSSPVRQAPEVPDGMFDALRAGDPHLLGATLGNDLQSAALTIAPLLRRTLAAGRDLGAIAGIVSGSGPTCAFLCTDAQAATRLAAALPAEGVCRTTRVVTGPVAGARAVS
ncbi:MAG: 4-(cytidine 5'-diphospho)-2-C-methyl-D-erythritol kinase [Actinomycetota bacterium]|nr:4-(cytidine 5'-diphospho)-2-C-methyl-D-erythritol kinase [Actinomycetota bacterium]